MRRVKVLLYGAVILMLLVACEFAGISIDFGNGSSSEASAESQSASLEAGIDSPANGAALPMASADISYHASSTDGVAAVELSINGEVVSSVASPGSEQKVVALKYTWVPTVSGSHIIRVRAQNNSGMWSDYSTTMVNVDGEQVQQPQASGDNNSAPAATNTPAPTKTPEPTATPEGITIYDVKHDKDTFYYGNNGCGSHELTISARVTDPEDIYQVVLFIGFTDKESSGYTKLDGGRSMSKKDDDLYSVTLTSEKIPDYGLFDFAVMRYQIVVVDKDGNKDVRTEVISDLNIERCNS